jgi:hypothetical protein
MPDKPDEEIRKSIKRFEESLSESERNPDAQENTERLIERAAQPLPKDEDIPHPDERYGEKQTRSRKAAGRRRRSMREITLTDKKEML